MSTTENRRWAVAGPVTVALWIAGVFLITQGQPGSHDTGSQILGWYRSHTDTIVLGGWLFMLGCLGFVTFVNSLRQRLADAAGSTSQLARLAVIGAAMTAAFGMLFAGSDLVGGIDKDDINPATAFTFHHIGDLFFVGAELAAILPVAAVALVAWKTRIFPRWWAAFSGLLAIVLIAGPIGWAGLIFGTPVWTLGTSLFVLLGSRTRVRAAAATA